MQMRTRALARRRVPDELDRLLDVAPRAVWVAVLALTLAVAALVVWGFAGSLPRRLHAQGLLAGDEGPALVQSDQPGRVTDVLVSSGDAVRAGRPVLRLATGGRGGARTLRAPRDGTVTTVDVAPGEVVGRGASLYALEPDEDARRPPSALLFLSPREGAVVRPGMRTDVSVASAPSGGFGVVRGRVESVSSYPASTAALTATLGNPDLARVYSRNGPPLMARVRLLPDPDTPSGLRWSTRHGPPFRLQPGTSVSAQITEQEQSPFDVVFGRQ